MPKPLFIIACQSGSEDKDTGLVSLFHIVEKIEAQIMKMPAEGFKGPILVQDMPLRILATWMKEENESYEQEYEYEIVGLMPDGKRGFFSTSTFKFTDGRPRHRLTVNILGQMPIKGSGTLLIESKVRKVGETNWIVQSYPIEVVATEVSPPDPSDSAKTES